MRRLGAMIITAVGLLALASSAPAAGRPFEVRTSQRAGMIRVQVLPNGANVRWQAYLNGRNVTSALGYVPPSGRWIVISATNGVRFGRNRLVIQARYPGRIRKIVRTFTVSRSRPLAAAGPDRQLLGAGRVRLSAAGSSPARAGSLRYRWVIVRKPAGSTARLIRASTAHPQLITDAPGTYLLHLVLRERRRGRGRGGSLSAPSIDAVQIQQYVHNAKRGIFLAVEGLSPTAGRLRISGGPFAGTYAIGNGASPDIAMFFDRATMEPLPRGHASPYLLASNSAGTSTLSAALATAEKEAAALGHTVGVLLAATNAGGYSTAFGQFLTETVKVAGVPKVGTGTSFALYGVAGVAGTSWISAGAGQQRELAGLLAPDNSGNFSFAPSQVPSMNETTVSFATSPTGITVNANTIASGGEKPCAAAPGGYQVRILDANTLADVSDSENGHTFWTSSCDDNTGAVQTQHMREFIQRAALASGVGPRLVIVQGVGAPQHANPGGNLSRELLGVAKEINRLGGSSEAFLENPDALTGPSYALVGKNFQTNGSVGSSDSSPAEVTTAAPLAKKPQAALSGVLSRDRQWRFVVGLNDVGSALAGESGAANLQLLRAALTINPTTLAPTPFPTQPGWLEMSNYTARTTIYGFTNQSINDLQSSLCAPMPTSQSSSGEQSYVIDIRYLYCGGVKSEGSWEAKATAVLGKVRAGRLAPPSGVTKKAYEAFLEQLQEEGALVDNVNGVVHMLTAPYGTQTQAEAKINLSDAVGTVDEAVAKARNEQQEQFEKSASTFSFWSKLSVFGDLFDIGQVLAEITTGGALPAILGIASGVSDLAGDLTNESNGTPVLGPFVPGTTVSTIRTDLVSSYRAFGSGLERTRDLIVSDWARLQATKGISISEEEGPKLEQALKLSGGQFIWRTLTQSLFAPTRVVATNYNPAPIDPRNYRCPVWDEPPFETEYFAMFFWRPWGKQGKFATSITDHDIFVDRDNLVPFEGTYIAAGGQEAYVLSAGGTGYPYKAYTNAEAIPPYNTANLESAVNHPPQNLPAGTFAPLFEAPDAATLAGETEGNAASPQGITKQLLYPQIIRAAEQAGKLQTLQCVEPSEEIGENGVSGYNNMVEELNEVPTGKP